MPPPERFNRSQAIAALLPRIAEKTLGKYGLAQGGIVSRWSDIVGEDIARFSQPEKLSFRRGRGGESEGAVLHIGVAGPFAPEMTHRVPLILSRINAYLGYRAVDQIKIRQTAWRAPPALPKANAPDPVKKQEIDRLAAPVQDSGLRAALCRIGVAVTMRR